MKTEDHTADNPYAPPTPVTGEAAGNLLRVGDEWTIDYEMRPEDLNAFTLHHYFRTTVARSQYLRHWLTMTVIIILLGLAVLLGYSAATPGIGIIIFGAFYGIAFPWFYRARVKKLSQLLLSGGRNVGMLGPHRVQISPRGLFYQTDAGESLTYWRAVERVDSDPSYAYIYLSSVSSIVVARREFPDGSEFDAFLQRVRAFHDEAMTATLRAV